jgi:hypothetical protein
MKVQHKLRWPLAIAAMGMMMAAGSAAAQTVTFDFDNGSPVLKAGQYLPFDQLVSKNSRAQFSSASGDLFMIQSTNAESVALSGFSGNFLTAEKGMHPTLEIRFDRLMTDISLSFATIEVDGKISDIQLVAYMDSAANPPVGEAVTRGEYGKDIHPTGTLKFHAEGRPFDVVRVLVNPEAAKSFAIDNVVVTAERCQSDFDGDDAVAPSNSIADIFAFMNAWMNCGLRADYNHDGVMAVTDIFDFLNDWFAACP